MSTPAPFLSLVVPVYDEIDMVRRTVERIADFLDRQPYSWELIVVDDSGRGALVEQAQAGAGERPHVRVIVNQGNRGKGHSVRRGVRASEGTVVAFLDADLAQPVEALPSFLTETARGADVVIGRRRAPQGTSTVRRLASASFGSAARALLRVPFADTQCGMKVFRGEVARRIFGVQRLDGFAFDAEVLAIAQRWRLRVVEVPIDIGLRRTSTVRLVRDGARMMWDLLRVRRARARGDYDTPRPS